MLGVQLLGGVVWPAVALCPGTLFAPLGVGTQLAPLAGALGEIVGTELLPGVVWLPGIVLCGADVVPVVDVPVTEVPAVELPAEEVPAADVPAAEPAALCACASDVAARSAAPAHIHNRDFIGVSSALAPPTSRVNATAPRAVPLGIAIPIDAPVRPGLSSRRCTGAAPRLRARFPRCAS